MEERRERREREKQRKSEGVLEGGAGGDGQRWSKRENRQGNGGTKTEGETEERGRRRGSLPSPTRASACSLRRTPRGPCFQHAHTCVNQSNHLITNNLLVLLFSRSIPLLVCRTPRGRALFVQRQSAGPDNGPTLS